MTCTVETRQQVERAARGLKDAIPTEAVDVVAPAESQYNVWTLDAVVVAPDGVPPEALRELALAGLTLRPAPDRGEYVSVVATP